MKNKKELPVGKDKQPFGISEVVCLFSFLVGTLLVNTVDVAQRLFSEKHFFLSSLILTGSLSAGIIFAIYVHRKGDIKNLVDHPFMVDVVVSVILFLIWFLLKHI